MQMARPALSVMCREQLAGQLPCKPASLLTRVPLRIIPWLLWIILIYSDLSLYAACM